MDLQSPRAVSAVRRNPPRKAKQTPYNQSIANVSTSCNSGAVAGVTPFDENLLHSDRVQAVLIPSSKFPKVSDEESNNLKVFLRIRPLDGITRAAPNRIRCETGGLGRAKVAKDRESENRSCLFVNSSTSVTLNAPPSMLDSKRAKTEVYDGFSCIFPKESLQEDIYDKVMQPLVMAFMEGQSSLLVAMGPTGSGKTYTMFGSHHHLGIVPLALRRIFCNVTENENIQFSRSYYMSMFEIYSERGKSEKILDLSSTSIDLSHQHAAINNLTEVRISNLTDAEKFVAHGVLKRSTAPTNANNQSSRSHCVINIRCVLNSKNGSHSLCSPILTIVDLAGAERERKTGNQGSRLWESNFINNTSMVFGLCLRSLLEHQKNPKKPIEKHFKNSLLTRYLQDYMEGKKRITLILTVKDGLEDYADTSFILRQASPYMKIKFNHLQDYNNAQCQKRNTALVRTEKWKRRKVNISKDSMVLFLSTLDAHSACGFRDLQRSSVIAKKAVDCCNAAFDGVNRSQTSQKDSIGEACIDNKNDEFGIELQMAKRGEEIMKNFARAFWSELKQYKLRLKESRNEVQCLKESLTKHIAYASELEKELECFRNSYTCPKNLPTDECFKPLPVDRCDAVPLFPSSDHGNLKSADALHLEGNTPSITENSDGADLDGLALALDESCFHKGAKGNIIECPLSREQSTLQQDKRPSEASLSMEENIKESQQTSSFEDCFDINHPESFQSPYQSNVQLAEVHESKAEVKSSKIASISGPQDRFPVNILVNELEFGGKASSSLCSLPQPCDLLNENGCFSRFPEKEGSLIQEKKGQTEEISVLAQNAQLRPLNSRRPKRKLLPSSAMLLRDSDGPVVDENVKEFKGKVASTRGRSEGSLFLMRMLRSKLPR